MSDPANIILQPSNTPSDFLPLFLRGETDNKECLLTFADVGNTMTWLFDGSGWYQNGHKVKPDCSDRWRTLFGYNSLSTVYITNSFSQNMTSFIMTHQYDTYTTYIYNFSTVVPAAGAKTSKHAMVDFFNGPTPPGSDSWVVNTTLKDGSKYYNFGASYTNPVRGKMCNLESADAAAGIVEFKTDSNNLNLYLPSGACTDQIKYSARTTEEVNWREEP